MTYARFPTDRLVRLALAGLAIVLAISVMNGWAASPAAALEGEPLHIKRFTMQTTRAVQVPVTHESWGWVNVPEPFTQAAGHPDALTTTVEFNTEEVKLHGNQYYPPTAPIATRDPKDIVIDLPTGLLGNPTAVPRCSLGRLFAGELCPPATQVGMAVFHIYADEPFAGPIVNMQPEAGQSAEFGFETNHGPRFTFLATAHVIRTATGYGLTFVTNSIPMTELAGVEATFWGVPASPVHDPQRGMICGRGNETSAVYGCTPGGQPSGELEVPFLTWPSDCAAGAETATVKADSWEEPGRVGVGGRYEGYQEAQTQIPPVTGCGALSFGPTVGVEPDSLLADAPVGLGVNLHVPQVEKPEVPAVPEMRRAVLTFPLGMSISPGIVDGIQACEESGPHGINFTGPESEEVGVNGEWQLAPGHCPNASIIGTVEAETPLLAVPIKGHVYLAKPGCGGPGQHPCTQRDALDGTLYQQYLELGGTGALADTGVNIKVRLKVQANPATGQLTAVSEEIAQLPFSELRIRLNGGPRAPLDNPPVCGRAVTSADFTPWAAPGSTPEGQLVEGLGDATASSFFDVEGCTNPPGLSPGFVAGTVIPNAGKFSAFTLDFSRKDREQFIKGIQVRTPPGLLGVLSSVPLCTEAQANAAECPQASKIGTTRVASGAGSHSFEIEGSVYLTSSYRGAPFGLSIVTDAVAGPFNLGKVVVRARIDVDPTTSALTVTTDETGPYALPQILDGVPLRLQRVTVNIDRPNFMFNPTSCDGKHVAAAISGTGQAVANVSAAFAVGNCTSLKFAPRFAVSTNGRTSRGIGASLDAKLSYPKGALGNDANIAKVKVSLPRQLPSYLPTLQKACLASTFDADPAACPAGSVVGIARATTPLLPVGLSGPVYFVSHGGEEFPSLIVVLQGDGVRVDLAGSTFISKAGVTSSTFKTVPDVPVDTFELYLPQGKNHALAANGNLCSTAAGTGRRTVTKRVHGHVVHETIVSKPGLTMPTEFVAQNGMVIRQSTRIRVGGCGAPISRSARRAVGRSHVAKPARAQHGNAGTNGRMSK